MVLTALQKLLSMTILPAIAVTPLLTIGGQAFAVDAPATAPATAPGKATLPPSTRPATAPETRPSTSPATAPAAPVASAGDAPNTYAVHRGDLSLDVQAEGVLQPVEPYEVKITFKSYPNPLTITKVAPPNSMVRKGDVLIEFDPTAMNWALTGARNDLSMAKANLAKAESDARIVAEMDALSLRMAEDAVKNADAAVKWWTDVDGPQLLQRADLAVKQVQHAIEDQSDELEQLHKMYKDEELTSATADIVVKRAVRQLEQSKIAMKMQEQQREKTKEFDFPIDKAKVTDAAAEAHQQLEALQAAQRHAAAVHEASLVNVRLSVEESTRHLNDLNEDAPQFSVKSPIDGKVEYGQVSDGVWAGGDPKSLKAGEKMAAGGVLMRVFEPGKLQIRLPLPDGQVYWVEQGMKAKVVPVATPQTSYEAICGMPEPLPHGNPPGFGFEVLLHLPDVDARLEPGMKAAVHVQAGKLEKVLLIPVGAVTAGKVSVQSKEGHPEPRDVVLGKSDGQSVEVRSGLNEGDQVILPGKK